MHADNHQQRVLELENKVAILSRLVEISAALNSTVKIKPLLQIIMEAAAEITNAEAASVLLLDAKTEELRFAATTTGSQALIGKPVPLDESIAGRVLLEKQAVIVNSTTEDRRHYDKFDRDMQFKTRSVLGVPLPTKQRIIGVLEVINRRILPWTPDDIYYLNILAAHAGVAIEAVQLFSALQKANDELSQVDKLKNDFIAIASHELRTPLGVILGYASFLQAKDDTEVSQHASKVVDSALQLRHIIEDMVNLRYLQQTVAELNRTAVPLDDFLREVLQDIHSLAAAKGHHLELRAATKQTLYLDRTRIGMALTNVLNNAIRFTPPNGRIIVQADIRNRREVWISVTDNGGGIEATQIERIFEHFYQIEDHMTRRHGGLGIGLSIARAVVNAHGGRIWATSPGLQQGATFTIALPLAAKTTTLSSYLNT